MEIENYCKKLEWLKSNLNIQIINERSCVVFGKKKKYNTMSEMIECLCVELGYTQIISVDQAVS